MIVVEVLITSCQVSLKPKRPGKRPQQHGRGCGEEGARATGPHRQPARELGEPEPAHRATLLALHAKPPQFMARIVT